MTTTDRKRVGAAVGIAVAVTAALLLGAATGQADPAYDSIVWPPLPAEPPPVPTTTFGSPNPIDQFLARRWEQQQLRPPIRCNKYDFVRRITLDLAGVIPSARQIDRFLRRPSRTRRRELIDDLLASNRYAAHWGIFWEDLLRARTREEGTVPDSFRQYIQQVLQENRPYDAWVREMLVASGTTKQDAGANFVLRHRAQPDELAITVSQVFMGLRLKCVQCHDDNRIGRYWKQEDFEGLSGFFAGTRLQRAETETITTPNGPREITYLGVQDMRSGEGHLPGGFVGRGRQALAGALTARSNPYFARALVNRIWARLMGSGLVEPVDDFEVDIPPSHPELLDWLAIDFVDSGYDVRHLIHRIVNSWAYQAASREFQKRGADPSARLFQSMPLRRMSAEQLYDSVLVCCGLLGLDRDRFRPAIEVPYPPPSGSFLTVFGSHDRQTIHPRDPEATIPQALALLNGEFINRAVEWHENSPIRKWKAAGLNHRQAIERIYLQTLSRPPTAQERGMVTRHLEPRDTAEKWSDVMWALINTREFMFIR